MALFGNEEKKQAKEQAKLDAQAAKELALLQKYGVDNLKNPEDIASVRKIAQEMAGSGMMEAGVKLSNLTKPEVHLPISYQRTLIEQNFILIRQLDELLTLLKEK